MIKVKAWRLRNPEKRKASEARYRSAHRAELRAKQKEYDRENRDRRIAKCREYNAANRERIKELCRVWYQENRERHRLRGFIRVYGEFGEAVMASIDLSAELRKNSHTMEGVRG